MLEKFRQLSLQDLESWFGPSLTMEANVNLGFGDLAAVLTHISITPIPTTSEVKDVSRGKIEANLLSQAVADFLKIGMQKSPLVAQFFNSWKNPTYGEQIAQAFKNEYVGLRDGVLQLHPDEIFGRLEAWAGARRTPRPRTKRLFWPSWRTCSTSARFLKTLKRWGLHDPAIQASAAGSCATDRRRACSDVPRTAQDCLRTLGGIEQA
ncbi:ABC-three component system protein [Pseudomonas aeruginosa]